MRKFISFLALLVVALALPGKALAWTYAAGSNPTAIRIQFTSGNSGDLMLNFSNKVWSGEFVAQEAWINFRVNSVWNSLDKNEYVTYGQNVGSNTLGTWVNQTQEGSNDAFYWSGLTKGKRYRIEITARDDNSESFFKFRVVEAGQAARGKLYLYDTTGPTKLAEATEDDNGNYTFNVSLENNKNFVLSTNNNATSWGGIEANNGRFNPNSQDVEVPGSDIPFGNYNSGSWYTIQEGNYTITVNWSAKTLTATCGQVVVDYPNTLYLYYTNDNPTRFAAASRGDDNLYTFNVANLTGNFVVGKVNTSSWHTLNAAGNRYNPASQSDVEITEDFTGMVSGTEGAWQLMNGQTGPYTIIIDWANKKIKAIYKGVSTINLPLTSADFKNTDGTPRRHFFLVGERLGEWHLQPEWELTRVGERLELENRYFYDGAFAIAVVDNYSDYTRHKYTYYFSSYTFKDDALKCTTMNPGVRRDEDKKGETRYNPSNPFYAYFDADYHYGKGKFINKIVVTRDAAGNPASIELIPGTTADDLQNRLFTLVGDKIYNDEYCNGIGGGTTTMVSRNYYSGEGWQEGWIQFDPTSNKPYIDGNGEYLYHTSFTPDYLLANPVLFKQPLKNGDEFSFNSGAIQFVEYSQLPNLEKDEYLDFYKAYAGGKQTIKTNDTKAGNGYNFVTNLEVNSNAVTPSEDWGCYVVRDMWIGGEIKFWAGWGGNSNRTNNGDQNVGAAWFGENGGPAMSPGGRKPVVGSDINSGATANLYRNGRQIDNCNYVISEDGTPVYFNRVVLWYNPKDGVANSFIQFVQESSAPAIFASATNNADGSKKNYIKYNWYLSPALNDMDANRKVTAYEIRRYKVVNGEQAFIGYPEGGKVTITQDVTVKDLYQGSAGAERFDFTKYTDSGVVPGKGFAAGLYQYDIYVYFEDGTKKKAVSNTVPIYDDALVTPMAVALQVIELRDAYIGVSGDSIASGVDYFKKRYRQNLDRRFLTYAPGEEAPFFLFNEVEAAVDGGSGETTVIPSDPYKVDSDVALEFIENNPEMFMWTSNFYVRCLDNKAYETTMQEWIDNGLVNETTIPKPVLSVTEYVEITDDNGNKIRTEEKDRGYAAYFKFADYDESEDNDKEFYALLVKRAGNLADGNFEVNLEAKYHDAENTVHDIKSSEATSFDPVIPRPYRPVYRYSYYRPEYTEFDKKWGRVMVPTQNWRSDLVSTTDHLVAGATKDVFVDLDDDTFNPRELILQFEFTRPNVSEDIYLYYDINYDMHFGNNSALVPMNIDAVLNDKETEDIDKDGHPDHIPNRYRIELSGVHPRDSVYPIVSIVNTSYEPRIPRNEETGYTYVAQPANYGDNYTIACKSHIKITEDEKGLQNVHLGYIKRKDGTFDWMYKGHEHFSDTPDILNPDDTKNFPYEDAGSEDVQELNSRWYLFELKTSNDSYTYDYLVPHSSDHTTKNKDRVIDPVTGLYINDGDPLIGTYIAKGFKNDEVPVVYVTAMYVFNRKLDGESTDNTGIKFGDLDVKSFINHDSTGTNDETPNAAPKRERRKAPTNAELEQGNAGGMRDAGDIPAEGEYQDLSDDTTDTGYNDFISLKGATYSDSPGDNGTVTAVDVIVFESVEGEVRYYDLKGIRLPEEPTTPGVYVRAEGENITKFVVK